MEKSVASKLYEGLISLQYYPYFESANEVNPIPVPLMDGLTIAWEQDYIENFSIKSYEKLENGAEIFILEKKAFSYENFELKECEDKFDDEIVKIVIIDNIFLKFSGEYLNFSGFHDLDIDDNLIKFSRVSHLERITSKYNFNFHDYIKILYQ